MELLNEKDPKYYMEKIAEGKQSQSIEVATKKLWSKFNKKYEGSTEKVCTTKEAAKLV